MPVIFYNFVIGTYRTLLLIASPFNHKAKKMLNGRAQWRQKLKTDFNDVREPVAWIHCASLGEFEQGRPVIEAFKEAFPHYKILLTFYSPSGFEIRKDYAKVYSVHYLPWDNASNARFFFQTVRPQVAFFIKYEFWHHLLKEAKTRQIPVILCSAIFNSRQVFFKPYGGFFRKMLANFNHIFVQNASSRNLLSGVSIASVTVAGDTRMDRVIAIAREAQGNPVVEDFCKSGKTFIIGSSWPEDISLLAPVINRQTDMKFIIAPHEIGETNLLQIERSVQRSCGRYTSGQSFENTDVLIIDTVGMLSHLYQYGDYAYIGGAFGKGLHNILEAATFGLPLFFGNKNYRKFREARELIALGGAFAVGSTAEFLEFFNQLNDHPGKYQQTSEICSDYVMENKGATEVIIEYCKKLLT